MRSSSIRCEGFDLRAEARALYPSSVILQSESLPTIKIGINIVIQIHDCFIVSLYLFNFFITLGLHITYHQIIKYVSGIIIFFIQICLSN